MQTRNSFPHSAGIASSASAMSALALCLCSIEKQFFGTLHRQKVSSYQKASYIARLGSGSACRSVYPKLAVWGETGMPSRKRPTSMLYPYRPRVHRCFPQLPRRHLPHQPGGKKRIQPGRARTDGWEYICRQPLCASTATHA
jgi:hypothetical protein